MTIGKIEDVSVPALVAVVAEASSVGCGTMEVEVESLLDEGLTMMSVDVETGAMVLGVDEKVESEGSVE